MYPNPNDILRNPPESDKKYFGKLMSNQPNNEEWREELEKVLPKLSERSWGKIAAQIQAAEKRGEKKNVMAIETEISKEFWENSEYGKKILDKTRNEGKREGYDQGWFDADHGIRKQPLKNYNDNIRSNN